jgi:lysine-N-methylase
MKQSIFVPDYYSRFSCIGARCEDTCCSGWTVAIDRPSYQLYRQTDHPILAPLFRLAVSQNTSPNANTDAHFGVMKMKSDQSCFFQQTDKLCAIHSHLGEQALCDTCQIYPRSFNQFGAQREHALSISCPEAARLVLLNPKSMQFDTLNLETSTLRSFISCRFPSQDQGDPAQMSILNDFRALIIGILQFRQISVGARMMLLGWLLEDTNQVISSETFKHASELLPALGAIADMLRHPVELEKQFAQIQPDLPRKLETLNQLIGQVLSAGSSLRLSECLLAAAEGLAADAGDSDHQLLQKFKHSFEQHYQPYFQERAYIFENYLVNMVILRLFPFTRGTYLELYRELVFNLSIVQLLLIGVAGKNQGLTEAMVIQVFQSFARMTDHNRSHLENLAQALHVHNQDSFADIMWMLK